MASTNNMLQQAVAELLLKAMEAADAAGAFVKEQLPDVAQQYVAYILAYNVFVVCIALCVFGLVVWLMWRIHKHVQTRKPRNAYEDMSLPYMNFFYLVPIGLIALAMAVDSLRTVLLAWLAPKVLLLQWAASLVR